MIMKKLLIAFVLFVAPAMASAAMPAFPMSFWGNVTIDGAPAPTGTVVRAYYGAELAGSVTTQEAGVYGYTEPIKQKLLVGEGDGLITFSVQKPSESEVQGITPVTQSEFVSGETVQKNLAFVTVTAPTPVPEDKPRSNRSRGGGGRGRSDRTRTGLVLGAETLKTGSFTEGQIQSLLTLLRVFGVDANTLISVETVLRNS